MHISFWRLFSLFTLSSVAVAKAPTYNREPYSAGCIGILSQMYTWPNCTPYPLSCMCASDDFKLSVVTCVTMLLQNASSSDLSKLERDAFNGIMVSCPNVKLPELKQLLSQVSTVEPLGCEALERGQCNATRAFRPTDVEARHGYNAFVWNQYTAASTSWRYGAAILAFWGGICLIRGLIYWGFKLFPSTCQQKIGKLPIVTYTRQYLTLPPLLTRYHSEPYPFLKYITLNLPTREQSVIITMFLGLTIGLTFGYKMYTPNYVWGYSWVQTYCYFIGRITGYIILFLLPLMIVFAGRNNFLLYLTGWTQDTFVVFHKWIGRVIMIELVIHTVTLTIMRVEQHYWIKSWDAEYWQWGVVALVAGSLIIVQGMHMFRKLGYETFLVIHILCAVFFIIGGYYHVKLIDGNIEFIWAAVAVWSFERFIRAVRVVYSNPFAHALIESHDGSVIEYTIYYSRNWKIEAGQYIFIHLISPSCFWESHPFSMVAPIRKSEEGAIKLFARAKDGTTRKTLNKAIAKGGAFKAYVWVDGPYGHSYNLDQYSEVVFVAGGLGITVVFAYVQKLVELHPQKPLSVYWASSHDDVLNWFEEQINFMTSHGVNLRITISNCRKNEDEESAIEYEPGATTALPVGSETGVVVPSSSSTPSDSTSEETDNKPKGFNFSEQSTIPPNVSFGRRLPVGSIIGDHISQSCGSLAVLSCGPGGMNDDVRNAVANGLTSTDNFVEYIEESYSW